MPTDAQMANALRALAMDAVQRANSGHPGMPMGMADVALVLFREQLKFCADAPHWPDRDRFILSAGHGAMLLYGLLHLSGHADVTMAHLQAFRALGSRTTGHPEHGHPAGVETTTGPLGQGLANAVGMALAERALAAEYGDALCDHHTWVIAGDGCLMEGISHEAASLAGHLRLAKLTVLFDDNSISIDGDTALSVSDDTPARFAAYGWDTLSCDGHDTTDIARALAAASSSTRPTLVSCRTTIGFGAPNKQGSAAAHGSPLGEDEIAAARNALGWTHPPFELPDDITAAWRAIGARHQDTRRDWEARVAAHPRGDELRRRLNGDLPPGWDDGWQKWRDTLRGNGGDGKMATRQASGKTLETLVPALPALLGGSADLTGSNNTRVGQPPLTAATLATPAEGANAADSNTTSHYLHYGVREHGMAAVMNGLALHGGFIPYGGTFLVFSDYSRPSIRLAALMQAHVIHVLTHDSIGLGEDGPTHQPIEHLASLRLIPTLTVYRPCDAAETAECWRLAITRREPSVLALSRQALPPLAGDIAEQCSRGAYLLSPAEGAAQLTIAASGSEVSLAVAAQQQLAQQGIAAAVVSVPSFELFHAQDEEWRRQTIPPALPLLTIEAASPMPWQALAAASRVPRADHICMHTFGVSAPAADAFAHFGFTADAVAARAAALVAAAADA